MAIRLPRSLRCSFSLMARMRSPLKRMSPLTTLPGGSGMRRMMDRAVTDLPEPDSPTTPSVCPGSRVKRHAVDGLDDAVAGEEVHLEVVDFEKRAARLLLHLHVEGVAQAVAQQDERQHGGEDGEARAEHEPRGREQCTSAPRRACGPKRAPAAGCPCRGSSAPPRSGWRRRCSSWRSTMIGAMALGMMCRTRMRRRGRAHGPGGVDVLVLLHRQDRAAEHAGDARPAQKADGDEDVLQAPCPARR